MLRDIYESDLHRLSGLCRDRTTVLLLIAAAFFIHYELV